MIQTLQMGLPGGIEILIILFISVFALALPLLVSVLIYRDADTRGSQHAVAWALGAFFGSLVVWVLYLFVRDEVGSGDAV